MSLLARLAQLAATLLAAALAIFLVLELLPGDPALLMLGTEARPDTLAALRAELGLDQPIGWRFLTWLAALAHGDLGRSVTYGVPVAELVRDRLLVSFPLALLALLLAALLGIAAGAWAASGRGRLPDHVVGATTQLWMALPNFWLAILLILAFAVGLGWFQAGGFPGWSAGPGPALRALLLPAVALALPQAAILARVTRSAVLDALAEDYVRAARARGLTGWQALRRHALRNALIPIVTILGLQFSFLLAGTVIVENVFYLPGLGRLVFQAIAQRDLVTVRGVVVLLVGSVVLVNGLVDLLARRLDPRLRRPADPARA